jgi:hypothetical protein
LRASWLQKANDQAALNGVQKVIAAGPQNCRAHDYHGRALWQLGKLADAAKAFGTLAYQSVGARRRLAQANRR